MSASSAQSLTPPAFNSETALTSFVTTQFNAPSYALTSGQYAGDVLTIPNVPAGTYYFYACFEIDVSSTLADYEVIFCDTPNFGSTALTNTLTSSGNPATAVSVGGYVPATTNGIVTLTSATDVYLYIELNIVTGQPATSWTPSNISIGYIKLA